MKGLIPADATGILYGEAGSYKTFVALDLALHIAHGLPWCDRKTLGGLVLYVAGEGGSSLRYRIEAWHKRQNLDPGAVPLRVCTTPLPLNDKDCAASVKAAIRQLGTELGAPVLILIDTLSQNFDGDENSTSEMAAFFRILTTEIRAACQGSSVILIHHTGHDKTRARGSYTIKANTDFMFRLEGQAHKATLTCEKMKDAECPAPLSFDLHVMDLGVDEDADPRSSLTAEFSPTASAPATSQRRHSKHSATLLAVMRDLEHGALEPEIREAFNKACRELTEEARRRGFNRALEAARQDGWIVRSPSGVLSLAARSMQDAHDIDA